MYMYVCMHVCMYVSLYVCMHPCAHIGLEFSEHSASFFLFQVGSEGVVAAVQRFVVDLRVGKRDTDEGPATFRSEGGAGAAVPRCNHVLHDSFHRMQSLCDGGLMLYMKS